jgi:signal peptidase II
LDNQKRKWLIFLATASVVIFLDQLTKYLVRTNWELQNWEIIPGWLSFHYTQNPGMALGIDILDTLYISLFAVAATIFIIVYVFRSISIASLPFMFLMGLVVGGAVGNILDRIYMGILQGYGGILEGHVVDFIHFTLRINDWAVFPYIFNVADMSISLAVILFIFFNKKFLPPDATPKTEDTIDGSEQTPVVETKDAN